MINFGKIDHFMLLGGGEVLANTAIELMKRNFKVTIITSERHANEIILGSKDQISLAKFLDKKKIPFYLSDDVNNDQKVISWITKTTLGLSLAAAWIFKKEFISLFNGRLVNLHRSNLPYYRGGGGYCWRIMRGERQGGHTLHLVTPGIDDGKIVKQNLYTFPSNYTLPQEFYQHALTIDANFLGEFFDELAQEREFKLTTQNESKSTYWPRLHTDSQGYINWDWKMNHIKQFIHAFDDPYPGARTFVNEKGVRLKKCHSTTEDGVFHPFQTGIIYRITDGKVFVAAQEGSIVLTSVTDEEANEVISKLHIGDRFYTPRDYLEQAKESRIIYTPKGLKTQVLSNTSVQM